MFEETTENASISNVNSIYFVLGTTSLMQFTASRFLVGLQTYLEYMRHPSSSPTLLIIAPQFPSSLSSPVCQPTHPLLQTTPNNIESPSHKNIIYHAFQDVVRRRQGYDYFKDRVIVPSSCYCKSTLISGLTLLRHVGEMKFQPENTQ